MAEPGAKVKITVKFTINRCNYLFPPIKALTSIFSFGRWLIRIDQIFSSDMLS
jgi:hypothetical protein